MTYQVVLTVGSTRFTDLVSSFCSAPALDALDARYPSAALLAQIGDSDLPPSIHLGVQSYKSLSVEVVKFLPDLELRVGEASLVISHAGAGSILSFLRPSNPNPRSIHSTPSLSRHLILVPNATLMDSHQADLAEEMATRDWAIVCAPLDLATTVDNLHAPWSSNSGAICPPFDFKKISNILDSTLGFN